MHIRPIIAFNKAQKEGAARIFDGLSVVSLVSFASYVTGHMQLDRVDAVGLAMVIMIFVFMSFWLRKDLE